MADPARVSVIVPVRDRRDSLRATLHALDAQTFRDFEVIVADDGSSDGSGELAHATGARVVRTEGIGAVGARMEALKVASGEIFAFTDSDCEPTEDWLSAGVAAIDKGADVVQGPTKPTGRVDVLQRSMWHTGHEGLFATCNVFFRREAYEAAGGFDDAAAHRLGFRAGRDGRALGFGEDTLLGWRVARRGTSVVAEDAIVLHDVTSPPVGELVWRSWMAGGFPALVRDVPELRTLLLKQGVFLGTRRIPLYAAIAGAFLRSRRVAFAGSAWWIASRARDARRATGPIERRLLSIPVEMAIDVVIASALIWGSVRSRSVVL